MADGWRQPGSSFKAINYITGIDDHTKTAASMYMDVVTDFGGGYAPGDADLVERGPLRMREAIKLSLNIPAIKNAAEVGPDHVFAEAQKFGIKFQKSTNQAGVSIGIGTLELHYADLHQRLRRDRQRRRADAPDVHPHGQGRERQAVVWPRSPAASP